MSLGKAVFVKSVTAELEEVGRWMADYGEVDFENSAEPASVHLSSRRKQATWFFVSRYGGVKKESDGVEVVHIAQGIRPGRLSESDLEDIVKYQLHF